MSTLHTNDEMDSCLHVIVPLLLDWYDRNARSLPWRDEPTPYRVWISEIMLQQTRVEAVKPYFARFIADLPDLHALATCPQEQLFKLWEGLGYYSRARNLQKAARAVEVQNGGRLPASYDELLALPGIGSYTAGAIASIAFGIPVPAVDGNVLRVISRVLARTDDILDPKVKRRMETELSAVLPTDRPGDFNQSLMELGATVCLPRGQAKCLVCPLREICEANRLGLVSELPKKRAKQPRKIETRTVFVLFTADHRVILCQRPRSGLLAGLWEFPCAEGLLEPQAAEAALSGWGLTVTQLEPLGEARHIFTHIEWQMTGYIAQISDPIALPAGWVAIDLMDARDTYTIPSAYKAYTEILFATLPKVAQEDHRFVWRTETVE